MATIMVLADRKNVHLAIAVPELSDSFKSIRWVGIIELVIGVVQFIGCVKTAINNEDARDEETVEFDYMEALLSSSLDWTLRWHQLTTGSSVRKAQQFLLAITDPDRAGTWLLPTTFSTPPVRAHHRHRRFSQIVGWSSSAARSP